MNQSNTFNTFLEGKIKRQRDLKATVNQLDELDLDLLSSRFERWFGTSYLRLKRILTLVIGYGLIILAFFLLLFPEEILGEQTKAELIQDYRKDYVQMVGKTLNQTLIQLESNDNGLSVEEVIKQLDLSINTTIQKEISNAVRLTASLILILAFIILYVSRLTKKMRIRNSKISNSQMQSIELIKMFKDTVEENAKEISQLQEIAKLQT
jgi:predicted PurR-regulated permease PerM